MAENEEEELQEKDFISESDKKDPLPVWMWAASLLAVGMLLWGLSSWYYLYDKQLGKSPFLQVTNRQMSIFLWQFPHYMRQHVRARQDYLPAFEYIDRVGIAEGAADQYVQAPPELLFLYHTWNRLIQREFTPRAIPKVEFFQFLSYVPEWQPANWPAAPQGYAAFVAGLEASSLKDLAKAPEKELPRAVRMAFEGWKNYFFEGDKINRTEVTADEMKRFLKSHPHYARNYWKNIVEGEYPAYLKTLKTEKPEAKLSKEQVAPFLRQAYYNSISE